MGPNILSLITRPFDSPCHFLLMVHWNPASISYRFRDIRTENVLTNELPSEPTDQPTKKHDGSQHLPVEVIVPVIGKRVTL